MNNLTVTCGCGRKMALDPLRGKGSYRCGCGARIQAVANSTTNEGCAVSGCRIAAVAGFVVKLCSEHRDGFLLELVPDVYAKYPANKWIETFGQYAAKYGEVKPPSWLEERDRWRAEQPPREPSESVVYFIRLGDQVKIGTTNCLRARFVSLTLPPQAEIMLHIPGSFSLEAHLHAQFAAERLGGSEWFTLSPRLLEFIEAKKKSARSSGTRGSRRSSTATA